MGSAKSSRVLTLEKGMKVLELVVEVKKVTVTEVARSLSIPKSAAHRFLTTFKALNYLQQSSRGEYFLTGRLNSLAQGIVPKLEVKKLARIFMDELLSTFQETINLGYWEGKEVSYVEQLTPKGLINPDLMVGARIPAYCTAMGKSILANLPSEELDEYLNKVKLEAHTTKTITNPEVLRNELKDIRDKGYAVMDEELVVGLRGVAAPVFNKHGYPQYSISVGAWSYRISDTVLDKIKSEVRRIGEEISDYLAQNQISTD